jgi:tetratricopeptide (TPR) repeat protein
MPLALELAASWTRVLSVPELYERLSRNFDLLTSQDSVLSTRHSSMRGVLAYSWQNLDAQEKSVLAQLSVFQGGFTLEAAESVAKAQLSVLLRLINYALVRHSPSGRYDIHELVRQYAAEQLKADEAAQWYHLALESSKAAGNLRGIAGALVNLGVVMETTERLDEAVPYYEESLQVYREVGDVRGEAAALTNLGHLAERHKAYVQARDYYEQSIVLKRAIGDPVITAISLTNLGDVLLALGQTEQALHTLAEAFTMTYEADARPYALRVLWSYAKYYAADKRWQDALYLAAFLLQCPESEVWVQQEAQTALNCWSQRIPASQHQSILNEAAQISFEGLSQSLPLPD